MRGRKPVPTTLKLVSGTLRKHRANPAEPDPVGDLLAPPPEMTDAQKAEWLYALENAPAGLLRRLDRKLFGEWCIASCELTVEELALRAEGTVVNRGGDERITTNADGSTVKTVRSISKVLNPRVRARRDAFDRLMKATSELGFSPTSRSRITLAGGGKKETNRFSSNAARRA
jgi:P27 family predicted phage terminase small subunit